MKVLLALCIVVAVVYGQGPSVGTTLKVVTAAPNPSSEEDNSEDQCMCECDDKEQKEFERNVILNLLNDVKSQTLTTTLRTMKRNDKHNCTKEQVKEIKQDLKCKWDEGKFENRKAEIMERVGLSDKEKKDLVKQGNLMSTYKDCEYGLRHLQVAIRDGKSPCKDFPMRDMRDRGVKQEKRENKPKPTGEPEPEPEGTAEPAPEPEATSPASGK